MSRSAERSFELSVCSSAAGMRGWLTANDTKTNSRMTIYQDKIELQNEVFLFSFVFKILTGTNIFIFFSPSDAKREVEFDIGVG